MIALIGSRLSGGRCETRKPRVDRERKQRAGGPRPPVSCEAPPTAPRANLTYGRAQCRSSIALAAGRASSTRLATAAANPSTSPGRVPGAHPAHHPRCLVPDVERVLAGRPRAGGRSPAARAGRRRRWPRPGGRSRRRRSPSTAAASRAAIAFAWRRFAATGRRCSSASNWAETKRIFEASWPSCLRVKSEALGELGAAEDDRLAEDEAVLGPAERDDVDAGLGGQLGERRPERRGRVGEPGAVDVQVHAEAVGGVGDRPRLVERVERCRARSTG